MRQVMVRYRVKPDRVAENEQLVRAVYEELHRNDPGGLCYATFQLDDGVTFVHIAQEEAGDGRNPLAALPAFQRFLQNIAERCDEPPHVSELREVGSYHPSSSDRRAQSHAQTTSG
jgi:quinol monooxygenase YgiN